MPVAKRFTLVSGLGGYTVVGFYGIADIELVSQKLALELLKAKELDPDRIRIVIRLTRNGRRYHVKATHDGETLMSVLTSDCVIGAVAKIAGLRLPRTPGGKLEIRPEELGPPENYSIEKLAEAAPTALCKRYIETMKFMTMKHVFAGLASLANALLLAKGELAKEVSRHLGLDEVVAVIADENTKKILEKHTIATIKYGKQYMIVTWYSDFTSKCNKNTKCSATDIITIMSKTIFYRSLPHRILMVFANLLKSINIPDHIITVAKEYYGAGIYDTIKMFLNEGRPAKAVAESVKQYYSVVAQVDVLSETPECPGKILVVSKNGKHVIDLAEEVRKIYEGFVKTIPILKNICEAEQKLVRKLKLIAEKYGYEFTDFGEKGPACLMLDALPVLMQGVEKCFPGLPRYSETVKQ